MRSPTVMLETERSGALSRGSSGNIGRGLESSRPRRRGDITREPAAHLRSLLRGKAGDRAVELVASLAPDSHPANQAEAAALARRRVLPGAARDLRGGDGARRVYYSDRDNRAGVHMGVFFLGDRPSGAAIGVCAYLVRT